MILQSIFWASENNWALKVRKAPLNMLLNFSLPRKRINSLHLQNIILLFNGWEISKQAELFPILQKERNLKSFTSSTFSKNLRQKKKKNHFFLLSDTGKEFMLFISQMVLTLAKLPSKWKLKPGLEQCSVVCKSMSNYLQ